MTTPIRPTHLKHYTAIAKLLVKHWSGSKDATDASDEEATTSGSLADDLEALGPTYIKIGQMLSTRPDVVPESVRLDLARLQDGVEPVDAGAVREVIEEELGHSVSKLFSEFDDQPLATASLGQVHRAALRDGTRVAVKVQRPGVAETVRSDLKALQDVADWLAKHTEMESRHGLASALEEVGDSVRRELDYQLEADNLSRLRTILESYDEIVVPEVVPDYSRKRVLTMEFIEGTNLGKLSPLIRTERDLGPLAERLLEAYLDQAFVHGFVHADPHPGNVLLTDDGKLGIVDLGMVTLLPRDMRQRLLRVVLAVAAGDGSSAARLSQNLGTRLEVFDGEGFERAIATLVAREGGKSVGRIHLGRVLMSVARVAGEHGFRMRPEMALLGKTLLNLESLGQCLDPDFDPGATIRRHAPVIVGEGIVEAAAPEALLRRGLAAKQFADDLPERLDDLLDRLASGRFSVGVDLGGADQIVIALTKMANRITSGLVMAALIVGASLLMRVETSFTVFGYPGFAIVLFVLAAFGGMRLLWEIWRSNPDG